MHTGEKFRCALDFIPKTNTIETIFHGKVDAAMNKIVIPQGYKIKSKGRLKDDGRAAIEITRE